MSPRFYTQMSIVNLPNGLGLERIREESEGEPDAFAKQFCAEKVKLEVENLKQKGARTIPMNVKNFSQVLEVESLEDGEKYTVLNRIELDTSFDFKKIQQVMISSSVDVPDREGFKFCTVLLFTDKPIPLLVPYVYLESLPVENRTDKVQNPLDTWLFVNNKFETVRQVIDVLESVS